MTNPRQPTENELSFLFSEKKKQIIIDRFFFFFFSLSGGHFVVLMEGRAVWELRYFAVFLGFVCGLKIGLQVWALFSCIFGLVKIGLRVGCD